jgi:tripartite-type tricarboxylate transporter receptor subunit TctC
MIGEMFRQATGADLTHVPYRGAAPALTDVIAGHAQVMFDNISSAVPHVRSGRLRALAVTSPERLPALPDVPSLQEAGLAGFEWVGWAGLVVPAGTPREIVERYAAAAEQVGRMPDVRARLADVGGTFVFEPPEVFAERIRRDMTRIGDLVRARGLRIE